MKEILPLFSFLKIFVDIKILVLILEGHSLNFKLSNSYDNSSGRLSHYYSWYSCGVVFGGSSEDGTLYGTGIVGMF